MKADSLHGLTEKLSAMRESGTTMSMLFVTVAGTSDGLIAGLGPSGSLQLQYVRAGLWDIARVGRFKSFCRANELAWKKLQWESEHVFSADVGADPELAADLFDRCIVAVYGHREPYAIELRGMDWQPTSGSVAEGATSARGRKRTLN